MSNGRRVGGGSEGGREEVRRGERVVREGGGEGRMEEVSIYTIIWCNQTNSACFFVAADWSIIDQ